MTNIAAPFLVLLAAVSAAAADLKLYPPAVPLDGPRAVQQLLVVDEDGGHTVADRTGNAKFSVADGRIAPVEAAGLLRPVGGGETTVPAAVDGHSATAKVRVSRAKDPAP